MYMYYMYTMCVHVMYTYMYTMYSTTYIHTCTYMYYYTVHVYVCTHMYVYICSKHHRSSTYMYIFLKHRQKKIEEFPRDSFLYYKYLRSTTNWLHVLPSTISAPCFINSATFTRNFIEQPTR